jgi:hypothetical protein
MHGVSLSLGSPAAINPEYLRALKTLMEFVHPVYVSDHISWSTHRGINSHDLLPIPLTHRQLEAMIQRLDAVQSYLGRRLYLENPSAYIAFRENEYEEAAFITELVRRSGCGILLDINNLYVNQCNLGYDPIAYLAHFKAEDIAYFHLAGHSINEDVIIDTHDHPVTEAVWELYGRATQLFPEVPTLIERDDNIPPMATLLDEVSRARSIQAKTLVPGKALKAPQHECVADRGVQVTTCGEEAIFEELFALITSRPHGKELSERDVGLICSERPTPALTGLSVYQNAYFLRLKDCLASLFPTIAKIMTTEAFEEICAAYLRTTPPTHYAINRLGEGLADFFSHSAQGFDFGVDAAVFHDLARLEWEIERLYDGPQPPTIMAASDLERIDPDHWEELSFEPTTTWSLVKSTYELKPLFEAVRAGEPPAKPRQRSCHYIVYRLVEDIFWDEISSDEAAFLNSLAKESFHTAVMGLAARRGIPAEEAVAAAMECLGRHLGRGGIARVFLPFQQKYCPQVDLPSY